MTPQRIQRRRTKGWRMPEGAVYVGRGTQWGNPFGVGGYVTPGNALWPYILRTFDVENRRMPWKRIAIQSRDIAAEAYGWWFLEQPGLMLHVHELTGKDLCCWCPLNEPCHANFLLEMANGDDAA